MLKITQKGNWDKLVKDLRKYSAANYQNILHKYGKRGVIALASETPIDTGETALSWWYEITNDDLTHSIEFHNNSMAGRTPLIILIAYGHATRNGGYVEGVDFLTPAMTKLFQDMADEIWKEVSRL